MLSTVPLHPVFAAEIRGLDITRPISDAEVAAVKQAMDENAVCVFRETGLTDAQHVAFSRRFGVLERSPNFHGAVKRRLGDHPELFDASNLNDAGEILPEGRRRLYNKGNALWHTDSSFNPVRSSYSMLLAHETPDGVGQTEFVDTRAAYDALPDDMKARIEELVLEHWLWRSRTLAGYPEPTEAEKEAKPPVRHKLVNVHPGSGRKHLYIAKHADHVVGWPLDEGRALIDELIERATQPELVYRHDWRLGDLVIWDNRCTMHRATPFDDTALRRDMRRTTVLEPEPERPPMIAMAG